MIAQEGGDNTSPKSFFVNLPQIVSPGRQIICYKRVADIFIVFQTYPVRQQPIYFEHNINLTGVFTLKILYYGGFDNG